PRARGARPLRRRARGVRVRPRPHRGGVPRPPGGREGAAGGGGREGLGPLASLAPKARSALVVGFVRVVAVLAPAPASAEAAHAVTDLARRGGHGVGTAGHGRPDLPAA